MTEKSNNGENEFRKTIWSYGLWDEILFWNRIENLEYYKK